MSKNPSREHIKAKTITFNMLDPVEKAMYEFSVRMKKSGHSFNRVIKNFFLLYMVNTGNAPEGYQFQGEVFPSPMTKQEKKPVQKKGSKAQLSWED